MIRQASTEQIEAAINDPDVVGAFTSRGSTDARIAFPQFYTVNGGRNLALTDGTGVMLFVPRGTEYHCHFAFPPGTRGAALLVTARAMIDYVFTQYRATAIVGSPPRANRAVRHVGYLLGFRPTGRSGLDSLSRETLEYRLERDRWEM